MAELIMVYVLKPPVSATMGVSGPLGRESMIFLEIFEKKAWRLDGAAANAKPVGGQHPFPTKNASRPTWILIISAGDLQKVDETPADDLLDVLQHPAVTLLGCLPVDKVAAVEFDADDEILGYAAADLVGDPMKQAQLFAVLVRALVGLLSYRGGGSVQGTGTKAGSRPRLFRNELTQQV
jgi:hypothetical protein